MKSVNHRYCDINIRMPKAFMALEEKMRATIQEKYIEVKLIFISQ